MSKVTLQNALLVSLALLATTSVRAQSPFFQAVTNLNPIAYWPLQETIQPPAADVEANLGSLGAVANAYYSSTNVVKGVSGIPSGDNDPAVNMQSGPQGAFLVVPLTDSRVALPTGPFTVETWIYPTNNAASTIIAQTGVAGAGGLNAGVNSAGWSLNLGYVPSLNADFGGTISFHVYNGVGSTGGAEATFTQPGFSINSWYHVVAVFDGVNAMLYVNDVTNVPPIPNTPLTGTQAHDTWDELTIGCGRGLDNNRFGGYMDEVAIYTKVLTSDRVTAHYNAGTGGGGYESVVMADSPYMYWRMDAPVYITPAASAYPAALNYGTGANINGLYLSGDTPGSAGPTLSGFGSPSYACAFNGVGTDSTNAIPLFTNGLPYATNTTVETGIIITNLLSAMNTVTNNMSCMCWFKLNPSDNHRGVLVGHGDSSWRTSISTGNVTANTGKGSPDMGSPLTYNDGNWHFAVIVYTNTGVAGPGAAGWTATNNLYVDGILVQSQFMTNANASGSITNISIGVPPDHVRTGNANTYDLQVLPGSIAHVAYFTNALSSAQVTSLYTAAGGVPLPVITGQPVTGRTNSPGTGNNGSGPGSYIFIGANTIGATTYQWYFNTASNYSGATLLTSGSKYSFLNTSFSSQVTVTNLADSDSGYYYVVAANSFGSVTSILASFTVYNQAFITGQTPPGGTLQLYQNQNYTLSVSAIGESLAYQWLTNGVADTTLGTNAAYQLTSVQPAMSGLTYQVAVTNTFGSATSALVTLSVLPLPVALTNDSYSSNLLALSPSGYWPMHEVAPAAGADVETNLGSLGSLANGYYPDWAQAGSNIVHQVKGALANDNDTATLFNNSPDTGSPGYVMIPRTSPGTTLTAPFTLEAWVEPLNTGFGDIIGEGAFGDNQSSLRYGVRFGWGSGTLSPSLDSDFVIFVGAGTSANSQYPATVGSNLPIGQWYHVALVTPDGTNWTLYVNGSQHYTFTLPMATDLGDPLSIATGLWQSGGPARAFDGAVDEVAVYPIALQQSDVYTHYNDGINGAAGQYKSDVLSLNPLVYLRMDGSAYTPPPQTTWPVVTNYGTVGGNGVYSAGATPGAVAGPNAGGIVGKNSMAGNGMSSYADVGSSAAFNPGPTTPFSFGAWFRGNPTDQRSFSTIIGHSDSSFHAAINTTGKLEVHAGSNDIISATTYNDGNWHQFFVTATGTNVNSSLLTTNYLYVDGSLVAQTNGLAMPGAAGVDLMIGDDPQYTNNLPGMGRSFAGQVCEAAFWNGVVLSASQIAGLYTNSALVPVITRQPVTAAVNANSAFTNSVAVSFGSGPFSYQWYRDNQPLPIGGQTNLTIGATNASLDINPVKSTDASPNYYVIISNAGGSITSSVVSLTVFTEPVFTNEPILVTLTNNIVLFANATPTFNVSTIGAQPVYYQWFTNGVAATAGTVGLTNYTLPPIQLGGLGVTNFYCAATNFVGKTTNTPIGITAIPAPTAPYPVTVLADHPQNYWRLNEPNVDNLNNGTLADDYWGGKSGIYTNTQLGEAGYSQATDPSETSAYFGGASFQDNDAYGIGGVDFGTATNIATFSIEAWVNGYPQSKAAGIVSKGYGGGGEQFDLDTGSGGNALRFFVRDASGTAHIANSTVTLSYGAWYHVVGVCDESNGVVTLYINGAPAGTAAIAPGSGILTSTRDVIIGSRPSNSTTNNNDLQFVGNVDDVAIYNYALSAAQVGTHYSVADVPPYFTQSPPTTNAVTAITTNGLSTLIIPITVVGTPPLSYVWQDQNGGTNLVSGSTNGPLLNATLTIGSTPLSWNGDNLILTVNNAYGSTNLTVTLTVYTNAPLVTADLPPQVTVVSGKPYTYTVGVTGPQPYSYQWYNGAALIGSATNSTYSLVAGSPGSTSYYVVITNIFGATTSTVSTFTSVAPPSGYPYASTVLGLSPVGYWPLQETNAPAPATMETNYGTLGRLGNAYYAATNASVDNFGDSGALTGDSDTAVGMGINQMGYAFVPRVTPAITIKAPFTLEAWVNPSNTTYGVMIGEGGGTGLNGATAYGGFQTGIGSVSGNEVPQMQYYLGGNNTYDQFNGPNNEPSGSWYHIVSTYDGVNSITYVNGVEVDSGTTANVPDTWSPLCLGSGKWDFGVNGGARLLAGLLDEMAVYTNILSPARVSAHYNAGIDPTDNGTYEANVLADQPLLYYRMDCPGYTNPPALDCPTAVNYGSAPVNGAYLSAVVPGGLPGPANTILGTNSVAAIINGVVSCVDAGSYATFNPTGTQPFTALTWFRTYPADGRVQTIMSHGSTNWSINLDGTTGLVGWNLNTAGQVTSTGVLNDGNWHFVAGVYDGVHIYLYVDGALNASATATGGLTGEAGAHLYLGGNADYTLVGNNQRYFAGALAQAAVFTNALSAAQVQSLYAVPKPTISIQVSGSNVVITYTGNTLLSSTNVTGPFNPVGGATSPYTVPPSGAKEFYRTSTP